MDPLFLSGVPIKLGQPDQGGPRPGVAEASAGARKHGEVLLVSIEYLYNEGVETDAVRAARAARVGSRFALLMFAAAALLGLVLTSMSAVQLVQVRRFSRQILDMRARTAALAFFARYVRNPERGKERIPEIVDEATMGAPDFLEVLDTQGRVLATYQGDEAGDLPAPGADELVLACRTSLGRLDERLPWQPDGTIRMRRAVLGSIVTPASARMRSEGGRAVWDALFAFPAVEPASGDGEPGRWKKGLVIHRSAMDASDPSCTIVRVGVDAAPQRSVMRTHLVILGLAILSTLLVLGINLALYRTLKQRERMAESLQRALRVQSLGEMAATLAHELKNPVGAIRGYAQLMREAHADLAGDDAEAERVRRAVETIVRESSRLEQLVQRTLEFARPGELALEECDLREVADHAAALMAGKARDRDVSIVTDHDASAVRVRADRDRIEQVIANLLDNAIHASAAGQSVVLGVTGGAEGAACEVRDRGEGIEPGRLEEIFQPFHTTRADGTGLGLAVSRSIAEAHRGTIEASSEGPGKGSVFRLTLPR
jgi:signal transduction histidine kinase